MFRTIKSFNAEQRLIARHDKYESNDIKECAGITLRKCWIAPLLLGTTFYGPGDDAMFLFGT